MRDYRARSTSSPIEYLIVAVICGLLLVFLLSKIVHGADRSRDIVFNCPDPVHGLTNCLASTTKIHLNGDWRGTAICHGDRCWQYADLFPEAR